MIERRRLDAVDVARGLALVAMAAYHFTWDLAYFGVVAPATPFTPPMRLASHAIASVFLGLAGLSLALAHASGFRPRRFAVRLLRIGAAAALVSAATYAIAPETPIFFGILHCLFVASLLAVPFLVLPRAASAWAALALGAALVALPFAYTSAAFDPPGLVWLGLGAHEPSTLDWRPLAPWGGVVLIGLALARLAPAPPEWRARVAPLHGLAFAGRRSLAIYLIHQPVLIGLLYGALQLSGYSERLSVEAYAKACRPACVEAGGEIGACERACACVVRDAGKAGLASRLAARSVSQSERARIAEIVEACGAENR
jgi:uncharacterized membrane protein